MGDSNNPGAGKEGGERVEQNEDFQRFNQFQSVSINFFFTNLNL